MTKDEAYKELGLEVGASEGDIKAAFRTLAKQFHPDINKDADAEETFKRINQAYQLLTKPQPQSRQFNPFEDAFSGQDFFNAFFSARRTVKSSSLTLELDAVTPEIVSNILKILSDNGIKVKGHSYSQRFGG